MRLRTLVSLLFMGAFALLVTFIGLSATVLWNVFSPVLPVSIDIGIIHVSTQAAFVTYGVVLLLLLSLVLTLFTLLFNRLIAHPLILLTSAIATFTESRAIPSLPPLSRVAELRDLTRAFLAFTNNVEQVHQRDVEISRVKSDFISTAAHQLRTPLTGIRWSLEALAKENLTESQQALVDSAVGKSHDLVAIVGTLLDISSIESGKHVYDFTSFDVVPLAETIIRDFTRLAAEHSVSLSFNAPKEPLPKVRADRKQISWVLNNLIENAIRYTPSGGSASVSFGTAPDRVQIFVSDTGIGIPEQDRNNIFERFYRAGNAIAKENAGNGLGLYIARTIATDHGGDLDFISNAPRLGTTFRLSIPLA